MHSQSRKQFPPKITPTPRFRITSQQSTHNITKRYLYARRGHDDLPKQQLSQTPFSTPIPPQSVVRSRSPPSSKAAPKRPSSKPLSKTRTKDQVGEQTEPVLDQKTLTTAPPNFTDQSLESFAVNEVIPSAILFDISQHNHVYPNVPNIYQPGIDPTIRRPLDHARTTDQYLHQTLPEFTPRVGSTIGLNDLQVATNTKNFLTKHGAQISYSIDIGQHIEAAHPDFNNQLVMLPVNENQAKFSLKKNGNLGVNSQSWGIIALQNIPKGTPILKIPSYLSLRDATPIQLVDQDKINEKDKLWVSDLLNIISVSKLALKYVPDVTLSRDTMAFALHLLFVRVLGDKSPYFHIINSMPLQYPQLDDIMGTDSTYRSSHPEIISSINYLADVIDMMMNETVHTVLKDPQNSWVTQSKDHIFEFYPANMTIFQALFRLVNHKIPMADTRELFELLKWSLYTAQTRTIDDAMPHPQLSGYAKALGANPRRSLIPMVEYFNHSDHPNCERFVQYYPPDISLQAQQEEYKKLLDAQTTPQQTQPRPPPPIQTQPLLLTTTYRAVNNTENFGSLSSQQVHITDHTQTPQNLTFESNPQLQLNISQSPYNHAMTNLANQPDDVSKVTQRFNHQPAPIPISLQMEATHMDPYVGHDPDPRLRYDHEPGFIGPRNYYNEFRLPDKVHHPTRYHIHLNTPVIGGEHGSEPFQSHAAKTNQQEAKMRQQQEQQEQQQREQQREQAQEGEGSYQPMFNQTQTKPNPNPRLSAPIINPTSNITPLADPSIPNMSILPVEYVPTIQNYKNLFDCVTTTRDIQAGEELTLSYYPTKTITTPRLTIDTFRSVQSQMKTMESLSELFRLSLSRVPSIRGELMRRNPENIMEEELHYADPGNGFVIPYTHGFIPKTNLSHSIPLNKFNPDALSWFTPSMYYLCPELKTPIIPKNTPEMVHARGKMRTASLPYITDNRPHFTLKEAQFKYIFPTSYGAQREFDPSFRKDSRYMHTFEAICLAEGVDPNTGQTRPLSESLTLNWLGPTREAQAMARFYALSAFRAPDLTKQSTLSFQASFDFNVFELDLRREKRLDIVEERTRKRFNIDPWSQLSSNDWMEGFSEKIDDENEECKNFILYLQVGQWIRDEMMKRGWNLRDIHQGYLQSLYNRDYDSAIFGLDRYQDITLAIHAAKVLETRLNLDKPAEISKRVQPMWAFMEAEYSVDSPLDHGYVRGDAGVAERKQYQAIKKMPAWLREDYLDKHPEIRFNETTLGTLSLNKLNELQQKTQHPAFAATIAGKQILEEYTQFEEFNASTEKTHPGSSIKLFDPNDAENKDGKWKENPLLIAIHQQRKLKRREAALEAKAQGKTLPKSDTAVTSLASKFASNNPYSQIGPGTSASDFITSSAKPEPKYNHLPREKREKMERFERLMTLPKVEPVPANYPLHDALHARRQITKPRYYESAKYQSPQESFTYLNGYYNQKTKKYDTSYLNKNPYADRESMIYDPDKLPDGNYRPVSAHQPAGFGKGEDIYTMKQLGELRRKKIGQKDFYTTDPFTQAVKANTSRGKALDMKRHANVLRNRTAAYIDDDNNLAEEKQSKNPNDHFRVRERAMGEVRNRIHEHQLQLRDLDENTLGDLLEETPIYNADYDYDSDDDSDEIDPYVLEQYEAAKREYGEGAQYLTERSTKDYLLSQSQSGHSRYAKIVNYRQKQKNRQEEFKASDNPFGLPPNHFDE